MSITKNNQNIEIIRKNDKEISEIYCGNNLVYSSGTFVPKIIFRDIDENGNLTIATGDVTGLFDKIKTIGSYGLYSAFYYYNNITGSISFPKLTSVDEYGLRQTFVKCSGITSVSFPALISVGRYGLQETFNFCSGITSVSFPALKTIGDYGLYSAFSSCTGIKGSINFPALTSVDTFSFYNTFSGCTGITELHFRADAKSVIESIFDYSDKFGASNATIYFDL